MFNPFKSKSSVSSLRAKRGNLTPQTESITLKLSGLHCTSCATNIDLTLEDLPSVKSTTNYAKSETKIEFDPSQTTISKIESVIKELGYDLV